MNKNILSIATGSCMFSVSSKSSLNVSASIGKHEAVEERSDKIIEGCYGTWARLSF